MIGCHMAKHLQGIDMRCSIILPSAFFGFVQANLYILYKHVTCAVVIKQEVLQ